MRYLIVSLLSARRSTRVGGGHVRSLAETAIELAKSAPVYVLSLGTMFPENIENRLLRNDVAVIKKPLNLFSVFYGERTIDAVVKKHNIDAVLCFDHLAYVYLSGLSNRIPVVIVRCGGPNPSSSFPEPINIIAYSQENLEWFKEFRPRSRVMFMPNRVSPPLLNQITPADIKLPFGANVLLRICRIDGYYDWTVLQGARLARHFADRKRLCYIVIGKAESENRLDRLKTQTKEIFPETIFLSSDTYTKNAASYLGLADYVLGTGRGLMESMLTGKKTFCPVRDQPLPVGIDEVTFHKAFKHNFSGRADFDVKAIEQSIDRVLGYPSESYRLWASEKSKDLFSVHVIPNKIRDFVSSGQAVNEPRAQAKLLNVFKVLLFLYLPPFVNRRYFKESFSRLRKRR